MEENYCIYLHRNLFNNKVYIGQTKHGNDPNIRWQNGYGYRKNERFYSDIQKYGWDGFSHIILEKNLTHKQANIREQAYIQLLNSTDANYGYNRVTGPNGTVKYKHGFNSPKDGILRSKKLTLEQERQRYEAKYNKLFT